MGKLFKREIGITLIALVITIIVLLILAGVTIVTLTGDNGLLQKTENTKQITEKASEKERIQVEVAGSYDINGNLNETKIKDNINNNIEDATAEGNNFPIKVTYNNGHKYGIKSNGEIVENLLEAGETAPIDSNASYISDNYVAIIPARYTVSNIQGEKSIEDGLVVRDNNQNEWVWIPVSSNDFVIMFETASNGNWTMLGTSIETEYKTIGTTLGSRTLDRTNPGIMTDPAYREPDVLSSYDTNETFRAQAGFGDLTDMTTKLKDDYKNMIESLKKNSGFYVGRYEIGINGSIPQIKKGTVMNNTNWYNLYKECKSFSNGKAETRMIWGCQWDQICRFIKGNGSDSILDNSRSYGNYSNSSGNAATNSGESNFNGTTGRSEYWKIKNIYDIAGNCYEWTQEAHQSNSRAIRTRQLW